MQYVYIVGSKGFGNYGGYETFVDKLTEYHKNNKEIRYLVACKGRENKTFAHNNAVGFQIKVPDIGPAQAIYYDVKALNWCIRHIRSNQVEHPAVYILACRIGPFAKHYQKKIHRLGGRLYVNPDGHEWMRGKWSPLVRKYWKLSERLMVRSSDLLICDSKNIEKYIHSEYRKYCPKTTFIAYGADVVPSCLEDNSEKFISWMQENGVRPDGYYLIVGRFVPENNFEVMIREFMQSHSKKDLVIITTANGKFYQKLEKTLHFQTDPRVKFVGTVYDQELLKKIRENAYGYLHGHEVGGTNPSLLEALGSTKLNLLYDVGFNREVAEDAALYWSLNEGNLAQLIDLADSFGEQKISEFGAKAKRKVIQKYSWKSVSTKYANTFS